MFEERALADRACRLIVEWTLEAGIECMVGKGALHAAVTRLIGKVALAARTTRVLGGGGYLREYARRC